MKRISPKFDGKTFPIPDPIKCPDCRHACRMAFRNERNLYNRKCDSCSKQILALYEEGTTFPVFCHECWWSDKWDATSYAQEYDNSRPFFDQFKELINKVPRLGIVTGHNENCNYCNYTNYSKSSYLCFGCHSADQCYHCWRVHWSEFCVDCLQINKGNLCYETIDCDDCYNVIYLQDCEGCSNCAFLYDCKGCSNCIFCVGLRNSEYCIFNEKLTKEEYANRIKEYDLASYDGIEDARKKFEEFKMAKPHKDVFVLNSENVHGDHIADSRNLYECYHVKRAQDCRYLESCEDIKDSMDNTFSGWPAELVYETMSAGVNCYNFKFSTASWSCSDLIYSDSCHHSKNLFGCVGLTKKNEFCILNKQYSEEEYGKKCREILDDMTENKEWGYMFPPDISPHAYNETVANFYYHLTREEVEKRGFKWKEMKDELPKVEKIISASQLPDTIESVPDDILNWAIKCEITDRPFKIVKQELEFYRKMKLPIPHLHPDERHKRRMAIRNPRRLWDRTCDKCEKAIRTTYAPERPEKVFCEECYLAEVY